MYYVINYATMVIVGKAEDDKFIKEVIDKYDLDLTFEVFEEDDFELTFNEDEISRIAKINLACEYEGRKEFFDALDFEDVVDFTEATALDAYKWNKEQDKVDNGEVPPTNPASREKKTKSDKPKKPRKKVKVEGKLSVEADDYKPKQGSINQAIFDSIEINEDFEEVVADLVATYKKPKSDDPVTELFIVSAIKWCIKQGYVVVEEEL